MSWETPPQQPEGIAWRKILAIVVGTLLVFGSAVAVEVWLGSRFREEENPRGAAVPEAIGARAIGRVDQVPFPVATRAYERRDAARRRLEGYGWVDRERGIIHVPIEQAIDEVVSEARGEGDGR